MWLHPIVTPLLGLLAALAMVASVATAAEIRGTVASVESGTRLRIDLPKGSLVRPGDEVRVETVVPGIGPVVIQVRWRVTLVGEDFVIAEPEGATTATPQAGYTAVVVSGATTAATAASAASAVSAPRDTDASLARLSLSGAQLAALREKAEGGDVRAMRLLGTYHRHGAGGVGAADPRDLEEAERWYMMAADKDDVVATAALGFLHLVDRKNPGEAARRFRIAADKGDATAMYALSGIYAAASDATSQVESLRWLLQAAQKNYEPALVDLAVRYASGDGLKQNVDEAAGLYRQAADRGVTPAMLALATMYEEGKGVGRNVPEGFRWAMRAAEAGNAFAMTYVAKRFQQGIGVDKDLREAKRWYDKAAAAGDPEAMYGLGRLYHSGTGVKRDAVRAADWIEKAIRAGSHQAASHVMRNGDWGLDFRKELQKRMRAAGLYAGKIDGTMGRATRQAIAELARTSR